MSFNYRKRVKIDNDLYLNIGKTGISVSKKIGNVTLNSKGTTTINLGNGISYKIPNKKVKNKSFSRGRLKSPLLKLE